VAKYFLNLGTICPPRYFYSKNVLEVAGKKDRQPLTAMLENFTHVRRLTWVMENAAINKGCG
jgi:hypothetical protein